MAKQTKNKRTEVKDLSIGIKELTQAQAEQIKGGVAAQSKPGRCSSCKSDPCKCRLPNPPIPLA